MKLKKRHHMLAWTCALLCLNACTSDAGLTPESSEEGKVELAFSGSAPTRSTTTTISPEEAKNFLITVNWGGTIFRGPQTLGTIDLRFPVNEGYTVYAENCTEAAAEENNNHWGQKRFVGTSAPFGISKGETTYVKVPLSVDNASLCVIIHPSLSNYFKTSCTISLSETDRSLVWNYDNAGKVVDGVTTDGQTAFFNVGASGTREIVYTIKAESTGKDPVVKTGTITLSRAKNSRLNLAYDSGFFNLTVNANQEDLYVSEELTVGPDDIIEDDGKTESIGKNDDFYTDDTDVEYDQYN